MGVLISIFLGKHGNNKDCHVKLVGTGMQSCGESCTGTYTDEEASGVVIIPCGKKCDDMCEMFDGEHNCLDHRASMIEYEIQPDHGQSADPDFIP